MTVSWISRARDSLRVTSQRLQSRLAKPTLVVVREKVKVFQLLHPILIITPLVLQDRVQLKRYAIDSSGMRVKF